ncbi:hypothetical protein GUITHDRAFT_45296, partial [Guillardia theta CCMP2712]
KEKKEKKEKEGPKRALSAYMLFSEDKRQEHKDAGNTTPLKMAELAAMWKELGDEAKKPWVDRAEELKAQYKEQKEQFDAEKKAAQGNKPKKARSAYIIFVSETRAKVKEEHPDMEPKHVLTLLGKMWKDLSIEQKADYEKKAKEEKEKKQQEKDGTSPAEENPQTNENSEDKMEDAEEDQAE